MLGRHRQLVRLHHRQLRVAASTTAFSLARYCLPMCSTTVAAAGISDRVLAVLIGSSSHHLRYGS